MSLPGEDMAGRTRSGSSRLGFASLVSLLVVAGCIAPGGWSASEQTTPEPVTDATTTQSETVTDGGEEPSEPTRSDRSSEKGSRPGALESSLYDLVTAENRTAYAENRNLRYRDGSVEVVVELRDGRQLPDEFDISVESRHEHLVQAFVAVDDLVPLSEHENVTFVRSPRRPATDESSTDSLHP